MESHGSFGKRAICAASLCLWTVLRDACDAQYDLGARHDLAYFSAVAIRKVLADFKEAISKSLVSDIAYTPRHTIYASNGCGPPVVVERFIGECLKYGHSAQIATTSLYCNSDEDRLLERLNRLAPTHLLAAVISRTSFLRGVRRQLTAMFARPI